ncbi:hypothetical protein WR25_05616 isoform B [Diploscapter pachys]|uniref:Palmitoyltransferase n=1 Tax=Diploscapter pachys TaxID=2018661 RepID=A0A2A2JR04_9BILA|nr:hypothetical protein WR25_05616 isoform A [Diploscapter pachys]PAV64115.1 hypothetical protein WR25_05616 isoform B [Diploscapter pachys]
MDPREAAQYGNLPRLKELLDSGEITANWTDSDECSLLHWAAINNRFQVAELLIRHKCNVNAVGGVLRSTPLHWSARQGHVMMVALLVRNGAIVDKRDVEGFSALHCAAQSGATPVVAYLIAKGQPVDCLDEGRMTPAMWAAFKCTTADPLQILITLGADVNKSDSSYMNTPLHWATVAGNLTAMKTLIRANCDLTSVNRDNESALDIAVRKADVAAIRLLEKEARKRGLINATFLQKITERPVNNCIALNNHRSFILYLMTVVFATLIFDFAILSFWFDIYGSLSWEILKSCDQWLLFTFIVSAVSAVWCFCMLAVQIYQILLEITTNERLNAHRYAHIQVGDNKFDIRSPYS